jgi:hypothetical protein
MGPAVRRERHPESDREKKVASWAAVGGVRLPVNPCGYGIDLLEVCYETDCYFPGFGVHRIRWYFTDKPFVPHPTCYLSKNWFRESQADLEWDDGTPGEVWTDLHRRRSGKPPASCACTGPEGSPEAWMGLTDSSSPTFEPCRWGAGYSRGYSTGWNSLTLAEG